jgi:anti-anti-sigma factor
MEANLEIHAVDVGSRTTVFRISGRLDAGGVPVLMRQCQRVRAARRDLVLNLAEVSFIASSGVGLLLALAEEFPQVRAELRLAAVSPAVGAVIKLLNLDSFLTIHPDEDSALGGARAA